MKNFFYLLLNCFGPFTLIIGDVELNLQCSKCWNGIDGLLDYNDAFKKKFAPKNFLHKPSKQVKDVHF